MKIARSFPWALGNIAIGVVAATVAATMPYSKAAGAGGLAEKSAVWFSSPCLYVVFFSWIWREKKKTSEDLFKIFFPVLLLYLVLAVRKGFISEPGDRFLESLILLASPLVAWIILLISSLSIIYSARNQGGPNQTIQPTPGDRPPSRQSQPPGVG
jgi:hypothetical protein